MEKWMSKEWFDKSTPNKLNYNFIISYQMTKYNTNAFKNYN